MIKTAKKGLRIMRHQKSREIIQDDWLQPPVMSEDVFIRNGASRKSSLISDDGSSASTVTSSCLSTECPDTRADHDKVRRGEKAKVMKVIIRNGLVPGQEIKVRLLDGIKVRTVTPPRSEWRFENVNGEPRPYFLTTQITDIRDRRSSDRKRGQNCAEKSKKICTCCLSMGVYDSFCPYHGTVVQHAINATC
mmetsp:Transcript_26621/g.56249  ORF Transcript_26621/g.56249 Transcript_26621/m.56249 type:complete len:192 (-) Transcript_26621:590-1165(-)